MQESKKALVGQDYVFEQLVIALFVRGHVLLEGVPGTAKTLAAKTLAHLVRADFKRVQFTPDLMPSDIVGTQVFDVNNGKFYLKRGPVFANVVLADEINRAPAKTQAALLEAMEERQVTIEGRKRNAARPLSRPRHAKSRSNMKGPIPSPKHSWTVFFSKCGSPIRGLDAEADIVRRYHQGFDAHRLAEAGLTPILTPEDLTALRAEIDAITVEDGSHHLHHKISDATRRASDLALGASPRASIAMLLASKAYAAMQGRNYVVPDDIKMIALPVLRHRILLRPEAEIEGLDAGWHHSAHSR